MATTLVFKIPLAMKNSGWWDLPTLRKKSESMNYWGYDLFAGAGGMSLGASRAGISVRWAIELDPYAVRTFSHNHPDVSIIQGDIRTIKDFPPRPKSGKSILFGGPPCQGFSTSNQRTRSKDNPINWLFKEFLRGVKQIQPDWVVFENVPGIVETADGYFVTEVKASLEELGYSCDYRVLCASDFGVPQHRSRFFLIANRHGKSFCWPVALSEPTITVGEAIFDLPIVHNGSTDDILPYRSLPVSSYASNLRGDLMTCTGNIVTHNAEIVLKRYQYIPQGGNWEDIPDELMSNYKDKERCHTGIYHRLREDQPSVVLGNYRKNMLVHPVENRGLSVREAARLQSFPDSFQFVGSIGFQQQQVANAVPPKLSEIVFRALLETDSQ